MRQISGNNKTLLIAGRWGFFSKSYLVYIKLKKGIKMKAKYLALMIGACFSHNLWAANNITIEQRLAELEQRVVNAENGHPMPRRKFARPGNNSRSPLLRR